MEGIGRMIMRKLGEAEVVEPHPEGLLNNLQEAKEDGLQKRVETLTTLENREDRVDKRGQIGGPMAVNPTKAVMIHPRVEAPLLRGEETGPQIGVEDGHANPDPLGKTRESQCRT